MSAFERRQAPAAGWVGNPVSFDSLATSPAAAGNTVYNSSSGCSPTCPWRHRFREEEERSARLAAANSVLRETEQYLVDKCSTTTYTLNTRIAQLEQQLEDETANQRSQFVGGARNDEEVHRLQKELATANEANAALLQQVDTMQEALEAMSDRFEALQAALVEARAALATATAPPRAIPPLAPPSPVPHYAAYSASPYVARSTADGAALAALRHAHQTRELIARERSISESSRRSEERWSSGAVPASRTNLSDVAKEALSNTYARRSPTHFDSGDSTGYNREAVMASAYEAVQPMMNALRTLEDAIRVTPVGSDHGGNSRASTPSRRYGSDGLTQAREAMQLASPREYRSADLTHTLSDLSGRLAALEEENRYLHDSVANVQLQARAVARSPTGTVPDRSEGWRARVDAAVTASNEWRAEALKRETERVHMEAIERRRKVDEAIQDGIAAEERYAQAHDSAAALSRFSHYQQHALPPSSPPKPKGYVPPPTTTPLADDSVYQQQLAYAPPPAPPLRREKSWNLPVAHTPSEYHDAADLRATSSSVSGVVPVGASQTMLQVGETSRRWRSLASTHSDEGSVGTAALLQLRPNVTDASSQSDHEDAATPRPGVPDVEAGTFGVGQPIPPPLPTQPSAGGEPPMSAPRPAPAKLPLKLPLKAPLAVSRPAPVAPAPAPPAAEHTEASYTPEEPIQGDSESAAAVAMPPVGVETGTIATPIEPPPPLKPLTTPPGKLPLKLPVKLPVKSPAETPPLPSLATLDEPPAALPPPPPVAKLPLQLPTSGLPTSRPPVTLPLRDNRPPPPPSPLQPKLAATNESNEGVDTPAALAPEKSALAAQVPRPELVAKLPIAGAPAKLPLRLPAATAPSTPADDGGEAEPDSSAAAPPPAPKLPVKLPLKLPVSAGAVKAVAKLPLKLPLRAPS